MKILIINTDYNNFLVWLYSQYPGLERETYKTQMNAFNESLFGVSNFYSKNLSQYGHDAIDIHFNNLNLQEAWLKEKGLVIPNSPEWQFRLHHGIIPWFSRSNRKQLYDILERQIEYYQPDIVLNQAMDGINSSFLRKNKPNIGLLVGQHASPLNKYFDGDLSAYDLVISSLPNCINFFKKKGIPSELHKLAFDPYVLQRIDTNNQPNYPVSFVGGLSMSHSKRIHLLEYLCKYRDIKIWGQGIESVSDDSLIKSKYVGQSWGVGMYNILSHSKITLNCHINMAENYANNLRLYEATGVGTLLLTDWKENICDIFEVGKEIVTYRTPEECNELIGYFLENEDERQKIAVAGQKRTLNDHNYSKRMQEFLDIISKYIQ